MDWRTLSCSLGVVLMVNACDNTEPPPGTAGGTAQAETAGGEGAEATAGGTMASAGEATSAGAETSATTAGSTWTTDGNDTSSSSSSTGNTTVGDTSESSSESSEGDGGESTDTETGDDSAGDGGDACDRPLILCDGECVNPDNDPNFCGASGDCEGNKDGDICSAGKVCSDGQCVRECAADEVECDGVCIDPKTDAKFCGASGECSGSKAGEECEDDEVCSNGVCEGECDPGLVKCNDRCIDPRTDTDFCGATDKCEDDDAGEKCADGDVCAAGECKSKCNGGTIECGGECIDPTTNTDFCGASGDCKDDNAGTKCGEEQVCTDSICRSDCDDGWVNCDGGCIDPSSDPDYCGASMGCDSEDTRGEQCDRDEVCTDSKCKSQCSDGETLCDGICVDPEANDQYCGAGNNCAADPGDICGRDEECVGGECLMKCPAGEVNCDGACINPSTDDGFCGASGSCVGGTRGEKCGDDHSCRSGVCEKDCDPGEVVCAGFCVDPDTSLKYCGAKDDCVGANQGSECDPTERCEDGECVLDCDPGEIACAGSCIDPDVNGFFCGATDDCEGDNNGDQCNVDQVCEGGECKLDCSSLPGDFERCETMDGTEFCADTTQDKENCGSCNNACSDGERCEDSKCELNCPAGQIKCQDGGSERCVDPLTDDEFCGATDGCGNGSGDRGDRCFLQDSKCVAGECEIVCEDANRPLLCKTDGGDDVCVDPQTNADFCGATGDCEGANQGIDCGDGNICEDGACKVTPCGQNSELAPPAELDIMLVLDKSTSMTWEDLADGAETISRWKGLHKTVRELVTDPGVYPRVQFGVTLFPEFESNEGPGKSCSASRYCSVNATPRLPVAPIDCRDVDADDPNPPDCWDEASERPYGFPIFDPPASGGIPDSDGYTNASRTNTICGATPGTAGYQSAANYMITRSGNPDANPGAIVLVMDGVISDGSQTNSVQCTGESYSTMINLAEQLSGRFSPIRTFPIGIGLNSKFDEVRNLTHKGLPEDERADRVEDQPMFNFSSREELFEHLRTTLKNLIPCEVIVDPEPAANASVEVTLWNDAGVPQSVSQLIDLSTDEDYKTCEEAKANGHEDGWIFARDGVGDLDRSKIYLCGDACEDYRDEWTQVGIARVCLPE